MQNITLTLSQDEIKLVHHALSNLPFGQVEQLIVKIRRAIIESQKQITPEAKSHDKTKI